MFIVLAEAEKELNVQPSTAVGKWGMNTAAKRIGHSYHDPNLLPFLNHLIFPPSVFFSVNISV